MSLAIRNRINTRGQLRLFVTGFLMGGILIAITTLGIYVAGAVQWTDIAFAPFDLAASFALLTIIALAEEYIFRHIILRKLSHRINKWLALVISALLFAVVHLANANITGLSFINIFLGGLAFGVSYMYSRSLALVTGFHSAWNFLQGPVLGFPVSGLPLQGLLSVELTRQTMLNGGDFGLEGSLLCTLVLSIFFLAHLIYRQ